MAKRGRPTSGHGLPIGLGGDPAEDIAHLNANIAMLTLQSSGSRPSLERLRAFHQLRVAARLDPFAAYTLGNYLSERENGPDDPPTRGKRSLQLYERCIDLALPRLRDPSEPFPKAPRAERDVRDIASRAMTNVGARVANLGYLERAVEHFRQSLRIYPDNPNTRVCLGNMSVFHSARTGLDPLDGIAEWERAAAIGDYCHESPMGCPCRARVCGVARQVERDYGAESAREWVSKRYAVSSMKRHGTTYVPLAATVADAARIEGREWSECAERVAHEVGELFDRHRGRPLEFRVTLAGTALASFARLGMLDAGTGTSPLGAALERVKGTEPLRPFLGDTDWRYVGPPDTDYITGEAARTEILDEVLTAIECTTDVVTAFDPVDAAAGVLFHLDNSFRRGVSSMAANLVVANIPQALLYVPATHIGMPQAT